MGAVPKPEQSNTEAAADCLSGRLELKRIGKVRIAPRVKSQNGLLAHSGQRIFQRADDKLLIRLLGVGLISLSLGLSNPCAADVSLNTSEAHPASPEIRPILEVSDKALSTYISAFLHLFNTYSVGGDKAESLGKPNVVFISKQGSISGEKISASNLTMFSPEVIASIVSRNTQNDTCYIDTLVFPGGEKIVLGIDNFDRGGIEYDRKCFLGTIATLVGITPDEILKRDSRSVILDILKVVWGSE